MKIVNTAKETYDFTLGNIYDINENMIDTITTCIRLRASEGNFTAHFFEPLEIKFLQKNKKYFTNLGYKVHFHLMNYYTISWRKPHES